MLLACFLRTIPRAFEIASLIAVACDWAMREQIRNFNSGYAVRTQATLFQRDGASTWAGIANLPWQNKIHIVLARVAHTLRPLRCMRPPGGNRDYDDAYVHLWHGKSKSGAKSRIQKSGVRSQNGKRSREKPLPGALRNPRRPGVRKGGGRGAPVVTGIQKKA